MCCSISSARLRHKIVKEKILRISCLADPEKARGIPLLIADRTSGGKSTDVGTLIHHHKGKFLTLLPRDKN